MLSRKLFSWVHKVALFAVVFASLAPTISHAIAAQQGINSFAQQICTTDGKKITIAVMTTKGQQLATELSTTKESPSPRTIVSHLNHCPFCANPSVDTAIETPHTVVVSLLTAQAEKIAAFTKVVLPRFSVLPPPAQAPPQL